MFAYNRLLELLATTPARSWSEILPNQIREACLPEKHGRLSEWQEAIRSLPAITPGSIDLKDAVRIGTSSDTEPAVLQELKTALKKLHPWRKGPIDLFGLTIDTEWRSDWKWDRLKNAIQPLAGRAVLDIGCGNGYYGLRMIGAGARMVLGLDPMMLFVMQYESLLRYLPSLDAFVVPLGVEQLPERLGAFDTVFSMGVLHHRRSPLGHLETLAGTLRPGGELVLETLVIEGRLGEVLVPEGRYAQMRNVYFLPSCPTLESWLRKCGFRNVRVIDVTPTTSQEQRRTEWMTFHSLENYLDNADSSKTVEGHPAPIRAIFLAESP
ncbi:MAG: tRNA 5-methoxyuridine(34)/uridine 5-oxyacetic acid(34) synthase CmoB [Gemmataceae bacterium]